eukprot:9056134-Pyramimonas_sp.AAC.1
MMPNHKAAPPVDEAEGGHPRPRGTVAELWKLAGTVILEPLQALVQGIGKCASIPIQFKDGVTAQLRKPKGDGTNARDHYRTLNILDHLGKGVSKFMVRPFVS